MKLTAFALSIERIVDRVCQCSSLLRAVRLGFIGDNGRRCGVVKAMGFRSVRVQPYPAKAALARPVPNPHDLSVGASSTVALFLARQREKPMTTTNFILLLNACAQVLASLTNLAMSLLRYAELRRWRRGMLNNLRHRGRR